MSSAVVSTSAALGRPFVFEDESEAEVESLASASRASLDRTAEGGCPHMGFPMARLVQSTIKNQPSKIPPASVTPASRLEIRPAPEMVSSGIAAIDALAGGLPRGCVTEICGPASSGRTTLLLAALAAATRRGEFCVLVDSCDALDPQSAAAAGLELDRLLWVRCGESTSQKKSPLLAPRTREKWGTRTAANQSEHCLEQVLRATDLLLESGGFGMIVLDLGDLPPQAARRIPLTTWFRFRRAIERTPTVLLAIEQQPIAGSCSSLLLRLGVLSTQYAVRSSNETFVEQAAGAECEATQELRPAHAQLLTGLRIQAELIHSRLERKPMRSVIFAARTAWAG